MGLRIAVVHWTEDDGTGTALCDQINRMGHESVPFLYKQPVPVTVDIVLTFAPYNRYIQIPQQIGAIPFEKRPIYIHWNTEGNLDPNVPWLVHYLSGQLRSWLGRHEGHSNNLFAELEERLNRLRYFGDYVYGMNRGWIDILAECSEYFANRFQRNGYPARYIPWGTMPEWYEDLGLDRDIDVLWMGNLRTRRRRTIFGQVRKGLEARGVKLYVANNEENPFIFGDIRTRILNRSKITLNLAPMKNIWHFPQRFHLAASNQSMVVSEPLFPHNRQYVPGQHYAPAPANQLVDTILYYLDHEEERKQVVENAYKLATQELTLERSVTMLINCASEAKVKREAEIARSGSHPSRGIYSINR